MGQELVAMVLGGFMVALGGLISILQTITIADIEEKKRQLRHGRIR